MSTPDPDVEFLITAIEPLVGPLYDSLDEAAEIAAGHFADYDFTPDYQPCQSHLTRAHVRRLLKVKQVRGEIEPWEVTAPQPNVQVCLRLNLLRLLLLRPAGLQVPKPGTTASRVSYYSNHHAYLHGVAASNLIGLWASDEDGEIAVQIVRTVREVRYTNSVPVDIKFWLPRKVEDISKLEFRPTDDEMCVELPFEKTEIDEKPASDDTAS
jgi:hypothetical protein